jgi:anti-anti-sigma factor
MKAETWGWNHVMEIQFSDEGGRLIARPAGRLEAADGDALAAAVEQHLAPGTSQVMIDLEKLDFINYGGIRSILRLARNLKDRDTEIAFRHATGIVWEALDVSGLDDIFPFEPPVRGTKSEDGTP